MTPEEISKKLEEQAQKIDAIYKAVERIRKYFLITTWVTVIFIVVPLIGLFFAIPYFMNTYVNSLGSLGAGGSVDASSLLNSVKDLGL